MACSKKDVECFFDTVNDFEAFARSGTHVREYYLDISHAEQKKRLKERESDPLQTWKNSPIDAQALRNGTSTPALATRCSDAHTMSSLRGILCAPITSRQGPPDARSSGEFTPKEEVPCRPIKTSFSPIRTKPPDRRRGGRSG
jgi:hypothetical protein